MSKLIHHRMMDALERNFFPHICSIQRNVPVQDTTGQMIESWSIVTGCESLPCRKAAVSANEQRGNQIYLEATEKIILIGTYTGLNETMRAVVGGQAYDILGVEPDSEGINTRLMVRIVR